MAKFFFIYSVLFYSIFLIIESQSNNAVIVDKYDKKARTRSIVSENGNLDMILSDYGEAFFEVTYPEDVGYTYRIQIAKSIGSSFNHTYENVLLVLSQPFDACSTIKNTNQLRGNFAFIIRGECTFLTKAINAEKAGAIGVIVADNDPANDLLIDMMGDETDRISNIPSVFLPWKDGYMIKKSIEENGLFYASINIPLNLTLKSSSFRLKPAPWSYW